MPRQIKIAMIMPGPNDPTSFYRAIGPFAMLQKQDERISLQFPNINPDDPQSYWAPLSLCDMVFMQRPCLPFHFNLLLAAKDCGMPVWIDFDDDNLSVPEENPMYGMYGNQDIKGCIVRLARYADVVTVSTEVLKKKYSIYNKNVLLVPNAIDDRFLRFKGAVPSTPREKRIMFRGTATHSDNLQTISKELKELSHEYRDWKFLFFGCNPFEITRGMKNKEIWGLVPTTIDTYKKLLEAHATCLYYPLAKNDHSQARSHVSWLEATLSGTQVVASKHPEFDRPGILNFENPSEFKSIIESLIRGEVDIDKNVEASWQHILANYTLSNVNKLRDDLINQIWSHIK